MRKRLLQRHFVLISLSCYALDFRARTLFVYRLYSVVYLFEKLNPFLHALRGRHQGPNIGRDGVEPQLGIGCFDFKVNLVNNDKVILCQLVFTVAGKQVLEFVSAVNFDFLSFGFV